MNQAAHVAGPKKTGMVNKFIYTYTRLRLLGLILLLG